MAPNEKILRAISNRAEARAQAADVDGLLAIIEACEQGLELARRNLAVIAPNYEAEQQEREERRLRSEMEKQERSNLYRAVMDCGGIALSSDDVREEYRAIPPSYRRRDGVGGDVVAEHLASNHPEFGITDENALLQYFVNRAASDRATS